MLKKHLKIKSFADSSSQIQAEIKELEETAYILAVHEFCDGILSVVADSDLKKEVLFEICEGDFDDVYWSFTEVKDGYGIPSEIGPYLDEHYSSFFHRSDKTMWHILKIQKGSNHMPRIQVKFSLEKEGIEKFKKQIMSTDLYSKYFHAQLSLNVDDHVKSEIIEKKPKV